MVVARSDFLAPARVSRRRLFSCRSLRLLELWAKLLRQLSSDTSMSDYVVTCWNCLGEFDAIAAVWCSDDPKNPTKLCPFCLRCFCQASERYKQEFWRTAPAQLHQEMQTLSKSKDRLGDILIRMKKITTQ